MTNNYYYSCTGCRKRNQIFPEKRIKILNDQPELLEFDSDCIYCDASNSLDFNRIHATPSKVKLALIFIIGIGSAIFFPLLIHYKYGPSSSIDPGKYLEVTGMAFAIPIFILFVVLAVLRGGEMRNFNKYRVLE